MSGRGKPTRNNSPISEVGSEVNMDAQSTSPGQLQQAVTEAATAAASHPGVSPEFARAIAQSVVAALDASLAQVVDAAFQRLGQQQQQLPFVGSFPQRVFSSIFNQIE